VGQKYLTAGPGTWWLLAGLCLGHETRPGLYYQLGDHAGI
jgi:hypothetical protein